MKLLKFLPFATCLVLLGPAPAQASSNACYSVDSRQGWQYLQLSGTFSRIVSIKGEWTSDVKNFEDVGPAGYSSGATEEANAAKYDKDLPLGALLAGVPGTPYGVVTEPLLLEEPIDRIALRINDLTLLDNFGFLEICFSN